MLYSLNFHPSQSDRRLAALQRTASAMVAEGRPFRGVLFAGLMIRDGKVSTHLTSVCSRHAESTQAHQVLAAPLTIYMLNCSTCRLMTLFKDTRRAQSWKP